MCNDRLRHIYNIINLRTKVRASSLKLGEDLKSEELSHKAKFFISFLKHD